MLISLALAECPTASYSGISPSRLLIWQSARQRPGFPWAGRRRLSSGTNICNTSSLGATEARRRASCCSPAWAQRLIFFLQLSLSHFQVCADRSNVGNVVHASASLSSKAEPPAAPIRRELDESACHRPRIKARLHVCRPIVVAVICGSWLLS